MTRLRLTVRTDPLTLRQRAPYAVAEAALALWAIVVALVLGWPLGLLPGAAALVCAWLAVTIVRGSR